jgi:hypothetical protein
MRGLITIIAILIGILVASACGSDGARTSISAGDGDNIIVSGNDNEVTQISTTEEEDLGPFEEACVQECIARGNPEEGITESDCFEECLLEITDPEVIVVEE